MITTSTTTQLTLSQQNQILLQDNQLHSNNELLCGPHYSKQITKILNFAHLCCQSKNEIRLLMQQIQSIEQTTINQVYPIEQQEQIYETGEEKLARELDWILKKRQKHMKRKQTLLLRHNLLNTPFLSQKSGTKQMCGLFYIHQ